MSKKLLLADDSITIQKVIGITFAHEDYDLTAVGDGDSALEKARAERPDLILADVLMPGRNGYELCAAVKQDPELKGVPVLLLTGTFEPFDETKATAAGADGWIAKPFESQALIDRVEELLARSVPAIPEPAPFLGAEPPSPTEPADVDDIWSDLPGFEAPVVEEAEVAGIEENFEAPPETTFSASPEEDIWKSLDEELPADEEEGAPFDLGEEEILALDESDILEEDLEILEADALSLLAPEEGLEWDSAPEDLPPGEESFMSGAAFDFLAAEAEAGEELTGPEALPVEESVEEIPAVESFSEIDYAFSLEESAPAEASPLVEERFKAPVADAAWTAPLPLSAGAAELPASAASAEVEARTAALSDAQIELIVEKVAGSVIERLAQAMIERIAWEVVPDLAESMIREEIRKIREDAQ